ncbi:MAG: AAA family ATPase [Myxococcota bacterium]|nr:AAA family ATPase [Myxococcota bacterium]
MSAKQGPAGIPRVERLIVHNYRALRRLELDDLTPLTVFLGPNGSGKSTVFDVFAFLSECFSVGLRRAWDKRGRFKELRTRDASGPIVIEVRYRESEGLQPVTYHLEIDEAASGPVVAAEWLRWRRVEPHRAGAPFRFLSFKLGQGMAIPGETPGIEDEKVWEQLDASDMLAVNTLGQFAKHPRVSALRRFITGWYLSYLTADNTRSTPEAGPQERLSQTGDNLPNVIQYLKERHGSRLDQILRVITQRVPRLETVVADTMADGRLLLQIKDAPFDRPVLAKYASDGTLKLLAYLTVLYDPAPPQLLGIEEPENHLHPRLLPELAEECRRASARTQLMVTTHSPYFVNELRPEELRVLYRDEHGHAQALRVADMKRARKQYEAGGKLGHLWVEGFFDAGDPLVRAGGPARGRKT